MQTASRDFWSHAQSQPTIMADLAELLAVAPNLADPP